MANTVALVRRSSCGIKPPGRGGYKRTYVRSVLPVGHPNSGVICGSPSCNRPGLIWLEKDEPGACPTLTFLLRRTISRHLLCSRSRKILNVFQRICLRFFEACGLASASTSIASSRTAMSDRLLACRSQEQSAQQVRKVPGVFQCSCVFT